MFTGTFWYWTIRWLLMDFERVLRDLVSDFNERDVPYAMMGGSALGALGISRATMDVDFLVARDALPQVDEIMQRRGYRLRFRSENVSHFAADSLGLGQVDFLHAFREISTGMLRRALEVPAFAGSLRIRTLQPEDIVGLKVQALTNDPRRERRDLADIELLAERYSGEIDWERVREYFALFGRLELYDEIRKAHGPADRS
jgi:predicted nucleotidyltransferase